MWFFVIAGAAVVDAFATGVWIGKKWGTSSALAAVGSDLAAVAAKVAPVAAVAEADVKALVSTLEADVGAWKAKLTPAPATPVAPVAPVAAALAAQAANAPK